MAEYVERERITMGVLGLTIVDPMVAQYADAVLHQIQQAPAADVVEVVHGRWVNIQNGSGCCSVCHRLDAIDPIATHCRYCGAKMDGKSCVPREDGE